MDRKELSQLKHLNKALKIETDKLEELRTKAEKCTPVYSDMPKGCGSGNRVQDFALLIVEQKELISLRFKELLIQTNRMERFFNTVNDIQTRNILQLVYRNGLTYEQTAGELGISERTIGRKLDEFFK